MLKLNKFFKKEEEIFEFPKHTTINCEVFNIEVIFSKKKNSSVLVKGDKLIFRLSQYLRKNQIKSHFNSLLNSISNKIEKMNIKPIQNSFSQIIKKGNFNFNGENFKIEISNKISGVKFKENTFYINPTLDNNLIEKRITKKIISLYEKKMEDYVKNLNSETYNFQINSFKLKNLDSKWGHCTSKGEVMINIKLLNAKKEILDYVIIHELAHIKVKNHSSLFWGEVERFCPNHKVLRKELRLNPPILFN